MKTEQIIQRVRELTRHGLVYVNLGKNDELADLAPKMADAYEYVARELAEARSERDALKAKVERLTFTHEEMVVMREAMRPLDSGHHNCRYCRAGTHNAWKHSEHCPYEHSVNVVERARQLMDRLQSILKGDR